MLDTVLGDNSDVRRIQSLGAKALRRIGISANAATIAGTVAGAAAAIAFARGSTLWGIVLLALSATLDALDGTLARESGTSSVLGGVLDLTSDRIVEILVIVGIAWRDSALFFPALLLVGSWYVNITIFLAVGAALERHGPKLIEYPPGILERSEAMIFFVVLAIVAATPVLRVLGPYLCYAMTAMEIATGAQRLIFGVGMLRAP
jgi:archaetidylinositol phosphate synthase